MTTLKYHKETDTFAVYNEGRLAYVPAMDFFDTFTDQDLLDTAKQAIECAGETITVPNKSNARGLKPRHSEVLGVRQ